MSVCVCVQKVDVFCDVPDGATVIARSLQL